LVVYCADQATYDKRIKKAQKQAKSKGYQVTKEFKAKAWLTPSALGGPAPSRSQLAKSRPFMDCVGKLN